MPRFTSRWLIPAKSYGDGTDETDGSPSVSFVSELTGQQEHDEIGPNVVGTHAPPIGCIGIAVRLPGARSV